MLKGAIIGAGKIAMTSHVPAYLSSRVGEKIKLVAGTDVTADRRNDIASAVPGLNVYESIEEMMEKENPDFVDICVPPYLHSEIIGQILKYKKGIICEKPFTRTLDEAAELKNKISEAGVPFVCCHQYKYSPIWTHFKDFAKSKKSDSKFFSQFNVFRLTADVGYDKSAPDWRTIPEISGGGIMSDTGVHYLYLMRWFFGNPLNINVSDFTLRHLDYKVEDTSLIILQFENGVAEINLTWASNQRHNSAFITDGARSLNYYNDSLILNDNGNQTSYQMPDASDKRTYISFYENLFIDFADIFDNEKYSVDNLAEAYDTIKLLNLCYKSSLETKQIKFEEGI